MKRKEFIVKSAGSLAALTVINLLKLDAKNSKEQDDLSWTFYRKFQEAKGTEIIIRKFYFTVPKSLEDDITNTIELKVEVYNKGDEERTSLQQANYQIAIQKTKAVETEIGYKYYLKCDKYKKANGPDLLFDSEFENLQRQKSDVQFTFEQKTTKMEVLQNGNWLMTLAEFDPNADDKDDECYLTTICVNHLGKADDCYELQTLRQFRDEYIAQTNEGKILVNSYYNYAPNIVISINKAKNKDVVLDYMYADLVVPTIKLIEEGKLEEAKIYYTSYALALHWYI